MLSFNSFLRTADTPLGQMPVLEIDGQKYPQSKAIARFIAKKGNLYGSDDVEALEIDATVETIDDLRVGEDHSRRDINYIIAYMLYVRNFSILQREI